MKISFRPLLICTAFAVLLAFGLSEVSAAFGIKAAAVAYLGLNSIPGLISGSYLLGVTGQLNMLDIVKQSGNDAVVGMIEENSASYPEFIRFPARTIRGTSFKTLHRTDYPVVGFRGANEGTPLVKSSYTNKNTECHIIDAQIRADKAVADGGEDGPEIVKAREASGVMMGVMRGVAGQVYYGVAHDAKGFPGLAATVDASHVVDAAGAAKSSVYALKFGMQDIILVGGNGKALTLGEWREQQVQDANDATKYLTAYVNSLMGWMGLQLANKDSFGRIKALGADAETGKTMTDTFANNLLLKMPANWVPDLWVMNRRSLNQLRNSRVTALIPRPPMPTEIEGVPIMVTDAITSAETI